MKLILVMIVVALSTGAPVHAQVPCGLAALPCIQVTELDLNLLEDGSNIDLNLLLTIDYLDSNSDPQSINSVDDSDIILWELYLGKSNVYGLIPAKGGTAINITVEGYELLQVTAKVGAYITGDYNLIPLDTTLAAIIDIGPDTLNLHRMHSKCRRGRWVTTYIELPEGYDVADINVSKVLLGGTISAESRPSRIGDYDKDGIPDLMVKFDRRDVIDLVKDLNLDLPADVELAVTGSLTDDTRFEGTDTIKVAEKGKHVMRKRR